MTLEQDQARARARARARAKATAAPADDGVNPVPVDDSWFPAGEKFPGYTIGHEFFTGMSEGFGSLPNAVPNVVNAVNELYHLHTDPAGTPAPEPLMDPWFNLGTVKPSTPGWEGVRHSGQVSGAALPAGWPGMIAAPILAEGGSTVGDVIDTSLDPNDQHKWQRTLEAVAPIVTRAAVPVIKALPGATRSGASVGLFTGSPTQALVTAGTKAAADLGAKGMEQLTLPQILKTAVAPLAVDDPRRRFGGPR